MQLRKNTKTVQQVVVKMRNSLMEPALRLKHSLQEPSMYKPMVEPSSTSLRLQGVATTASVTSTTTQTVSSHTGAVVHTTTAHGATVTAPLGPWGTARRIVQREGFLALYKGLSAVYTGIIPKMAIRFLSFEQYREWLGRFATPDGPISPTVVTFTAGLGSGLTEAVLVVTPSEVCKVRMMGQYHSLQDPAQMQRRKYTNVVQTAITITREEGLGALYKGVVPTMLRQGCNQAVNFTAYSAIKQRIMEWQGTNKLEHWQSLAIGGLSGGMGPCVNNPLDVRTIHNVCSPSVINLTAPQRGKNRPLAAPWSDRNEAPYFLAQPAAHLAFSRALAYTLLFFFVFATGRKDSFAEASDDAGENS